MRLARTALTLGHMALVTLASIAALQSLMHISELGLYHIHLHLRFMLLLQFHGQLCETDLTLLSQHLDKCE